MSETEAHEFITKLAEQLESDFSLNLEEDPLQGECHELSKYVNLNRPSICLVNNLSEHKQNVLTGSAIKLHSLSFPSNYQREFALADYFAVGKKYAKDIMGKLK